MTIYEPQLDHLRDLEDGRATDWIINWFAENQHGVVARRQLAAVGVTRGEVEGRVRRGMLHVVHRGVYAVGHRVLTRSGRLMAAVLACGAGAAISHRTSGKSWGLRVGGHLIDVTVPRHHKPKRKGIRGHSAALRDDEVSAVDGVPTTSLARTIIDLAPLLTDERLRTLVAEADRQELDFADLRCLIMRYDDDRLAAITDAYDGTGGVTESTLEDRFLEFLAAHGLPRPELNVWIELHGELRRVDCLWREQKVIVEIDGPGYHDDRHTKNADKRRDRGLAALEWTTIRVTADDLDFHAGELAHDLRKLLLT